MIKEREMLLKHVALECSLEEDADRFYGNLLGLTKMPAKIVPSTLSKRIFNLDFEYKIINYSNDRLQFEIFISNQKKPERKKIEHVCLEVDNLEAFVEKCKGLNVRILQIPRGESYLTFIKDYDGNLFEIKGSV
jgi:catechol 2,3-dioxygenase-like lactoylglutathione lyase family enzyme